MAERDAKGRFIKGHTPYKSGGRASKSTEEKYLKKLIARCSLKDWQKMVDTAISRAQAGDVTYFRLLAEYLLGKPTQSVDIQSLPDVNIRVVWDESDRNDNTSEAA